MFEWTAYLDLAKALGQQPDEASQRSSVSRAYYACFCSARNRLIKEGCTIPETGGAHQIVWDLFQERPERKQRQIAQIGRRLKRSRGRVDYNNAVPDLSSLVADALTKADSLFLVLLSL